MKYYTIDILMIEEISDPFANFDVKIGNIHFRFYMMGYSKLKLTLANPF